MNSWLRGAIAVIAGFVVWFAVATLGNLIIRGLLPGYTEVEESMDFSLTMMIARLVLGAVASVVAGLACAAMTQGPRWPLYLFGLLMLLMFIPVHAGLWTTFPLWYHLIFLGTLLPLIVLGGYLVKSKPIINDTAQEQ